jgi:Ca2+-binding EF-hand superfamily protein
VIQFDEFLVLMARRGRTMEEEVNDLTEAFRTFDQDQTGDVSVDELRESLTTTCDRLTDDEFNDLIREARPDDNGTFNYIGKEFAGLPYHDIDP